MELYPITILCKYYQSYNLMPNILIQKLKPSALLFLFVLLVNLAAAQKCNYEKNEIDGLTELLVKRTAPLMLTRINGQPLYVKAQSIGTNKYLKLVFYKYNDFTFLEEREVSFILSNQEELVLFPRISPVDSTQTDLVDLTSLLIYKLSNEQFQLLSQYPVEKFKYYVTSGFIEETINSKKQNSIINVLKCIDQ